MIYRDDFPTARRFSGAALLAMGYASVPNEIAPDRREEDLPVFSNALWYLGRFLYDANSQDVAKDNREYVDMLTHRLASALYSLVNNALVTELEVRLNEQIKAGDAITGDSISQTYRSLLDSYYGGGAVKIPDYQSAAWMTQGTFFYGPHQTSWSLAYAVALALQNRIEAGDERAIAAVRDGIGRSDTHFSADILTEAGLDIGDAETYRSAIAQITALVEELERALDAENM
ncbi:MAG: hypothetical protein ACX939_13330 [Hyphococcus sp.]